MVVRWLSLFWQLNCWSVYHVAHDKQTNVKYMMFKVQVQVR